MRLHIQQPPAMPALCMAAPREAVMEAPLPALSPNWLALASTAPAVTCKQQSPVHHADPACMHPWADHLELLWLASSCVGEVFMP